MSGKSKILNIEFGRRLTKVCVSANAGKSYQIKSSFTFDTPEGAFADGQINNAVELWYALRSELRNHNVADVKDAIFTMSSNRIASREVLLPALKDSQIQNAVESNASEWFPVDISKYSLSYMLLGKTKENTRINVVAVPLSIIEGYLALSEQSGLNIVALDFAGNSQYQVLKGLNAEGVTMYVNVEPSSSMTTFLEGGSLLMQRSFAYGGDELIANRVVEGENAYVNTLKELSVEEGSEEAVSGDKEGLERLVANVARSADFFRSGKNATRSIDKVVLMGTCSHLAGLKEAVAERVGCETVWLEQMDGMAAVANSVGGISTYIGCVGSNVAPLDLLPAEFVATRKAKLKKAKEGGNYGVLALAGCVLISGVLAFIGLNQKKQAQKELDRVNKRIEEISSIEDTYNEYVTLSEGADQLQAFYALADSPNDQLRVFFEEMQVKMPSEILLMSASATNEGVSMNVSVPGFEEAAVVINQFRSFDSVDEVLVDAMTESSDNAGLSQVSFNVTCLYPVEVVEEAPAEEAPVEDDADIIE